MRTPSSVRFVLLFIVISASVSADPPQRLRMAAEAPEGSSWAREFHAIDRDVQRATNGQVQIKWYLGGITGDELRTVDRIEKGQLDGEAGALFCDRIAPTIRVGRIIGLFQSRDEWHFVMSRLLPRIDAEAARRGFVNLGVGSVGTILLFSRRPLRTIADLHSQRFWTWDLDDISRAMLERMGVTLLPLPVAEAARAYDERRIDGFVATPGAALVFQFSSRARYYSDLVVGELPACVVLAERALDALPTEQHEAVQAAMATFVGRFEAVGKVQDDQLLGGLFAKQGLQLVHADEALRAHFVAASRQARDQIGATLVPRDLLTQTMSLLADYRSEHGVMPRRP